MDSWKNKTRFLIIAIVISVTLLLGLLNLKKGSTIRSFLSRQFQTISFESQVDGLKIVGNKQNVKKLLFDTSIYDTGFLLRNSNSQAKQSLKKLKIVVDNREHDSNKIMSQGAVASSTSERFENDLLTITIGFSPELKSADREQLGRLIDRQLIDSLVSMGRPELRGEQLQSEIKNVTLQYEQNKLVQLK